MNRNRLLIIIPIVILVMFVVGIVYLRYAYFPKYNWSPTYAKKGKQPYDVKLFYNLLEDAVGEDHFESQRLNPYTYADTTEAGRLFVSFENPSIHDSLTLSLFTKIMEYGNDVLVVSTNQWSTLQYLVQHDTTIYSRLNYAKDTFIYASVFPDTAKTEFYIQNAKHKVETTFTYFALDSIHAYSQQVLPYDTLGVFNDSLVNFISVDFGPGKLLLHTNPFMFSNYNLKEEEGLAYVNKVLQNTHANKVVWLDKSIPFNMNSGMQEISRGPLHYLISQPAFRNAWYILLILVLLALVFGSKRKQKVIPYITPLKNGSAQFAQTIATFYFQAHNHRYIADEMMRLFWFDLNDRYRITKRNDRKELIGPISEVTGIKPAHFQRLFRAEVNIRYSDEENQEYLLELHQLIEYYYKNRK